MTNFVVFNIYIIYRGHTIAVILFSSTLPLYAKPIIHNHNQLLLVEPLPRHLVLLTPKVPIRLGSPLPLMAPNFAETTIALSVVLTPIALTFMRVIAMYREDHATFHMLVVSTILSFKVVAPAPPPIDYSPRP